MDTKEYISSGILETYILGVASAQEKQEVECLSQIYPEIKQELDQQANVLENYLAEQSVNPSSHLRDKIMSQVDHLAQKENESAQVIDLHKEQDGRRQNPYIYWVAAASLIFIIFGYYHFNKLLGDREKDLNALKQDLSQLKDQTLGFEVKQTDLEQQIAFLKNPGNRLVNLAGVKDHADAAALVCWNTGSREVYLSAPKLPQPPAGKQYQLWAMVNGKPVDLGLIGSDSLKNHFKKIGAVDHAEAFAITLENQGGSATPHLDQLFVIGNI